MYKEEKSKRKKKACWNQDPRLVLDRESKARAPPRWLQIRFFANRGPHDHHRLPIGSFVGPADWSVKASPGYRLFRDAYGCIQRHGNNLFEFHFVVKLHAPDGNRIGNALSQCQAGKVTPIWLGRRWLLGRFKCLDEASSADSSQMPRCTRPVALLHPRELQRASHPYLGG